MTVEMLQALSTVAYVIGGLFLLVAVALFFLLEIPKVFGSVTGKTARKAIESIRQQNVSADTQVYKSASVVKPQSKKSVSQANRLKNSTASAQKPLIQSSPQARETTILNAAASETTMLVPPPVTVMPTSSAHMEAEWTIESEMCFVGSEEVVE